MSSFALPSTDSAPSSRSDQRLFVAVGLAVLCFFGGLQLIRPHYFLWDDNASFYLPSYVYGFESLTEEGQLAQLDPHQYLGYTFLASGQTGVLYPPVYLAMGLAKLIGGDLRHGIDILAVLHFLAAAWGMLALLRRFGVEGRIAALASTWWCTFPFLVLVSRNWIFVSYTAAFLPWCLLLLERLVERPSFGRALALAAAKALFFCQGYVQYFVLASLFEGLYLVGRWLFGRRAQPALGGSPTSAGVVAGAFAGAGLLTTILAAPLLLPMLKAKSVSAYRMGSLSFEEFLSNALDPSVFFGAQLFRMEPRAIHLATGAIFYVGLPCLGALAWGLRAFLGPARSSASEADPRRRFVHLLGLTLGLAVLALLASTRLYGIAHAIPLLSSFRWPFKFFALFLFYVSIAAALGFAAMAADRRRRVRLLAPVLLVIGIASHGFIAAHPHWAQPFGPNRVDRPVAEVRAEVAETFPLDRGRVVSLWLSPLEPRVYRFLIFQYATLAGAHHLGGYDPLVARENLDLAVKLEYSNIFRYELNQDSLNYLGSWSVRFLVLPLRENLSEILAGFPELRRIHLDEQLEVWENARALPFAYFLGDPGLGGPGSGDPGGGRPPEAVPPEKIHFGPDGPRLELEGLKAAESGGWLRLQVAPLDGYVAYADGEALGPPEVDEQRHPMVRVPPGTRVLHLRYVDVPFLVGVGLASALLLSSLVLWALARLRASRNPSSTAPSSTENAPDADDSGAPADS